MISTVQTASFFCCFLVIGGVLVSNVAGAMTEEQSKQLVEEMKNYKFKTVTTKEGLNFNIPEDMPIETRAGITAPIPFEEYQYFKLKKLEEKLLTIEKKIDELQVTLTTLQKTAPGKSSNA
jgi:hypothetical protein